MAMDTIARGLAASVKKTLAEDYYDKEEVNTLVDQIPKFSIEVVDELPTEDISTTTIYMLRGEEQGSDIYQEWIYVDGNWESLGVQESAFNNYYTKSETDAITGLLSNLNTTSKDNLVSAINEVASNTNPILNYPNPLAKAVGTPMQGFITTKSTPSVSASGVYIVKDSRNDYAILFHTSSYELVICGAKGGTNYPSKGRIFYTDTQSSLSWQEINSLEALSYIVTGDSGTAYYDRLKSVNSMAIRNYIGLLANLNTTNKTNIVNAINEVNTKAENAHIQYDTMPNASSSNLGQIIQYTGSTTQTYTNGYFYICTSDGGDPATYSWNQLNIQPAPDMSNYYNKSETYSKEEVDEAIAEIDLSNYYTKAEVYNKEETDEMIDGIEALIGDVNTVLASITTLPSMTTIAERLEEVVDVEETPGQNGGE